MSTSIQELESPKFPSESLQEQPKTPPGASNSVWVDVETAVYCCSTVARENGSFVNAEAIRNRRFGKRTHVSIQEMMELGADFDLKLELRRLSWSDLIVGGFAGPVLLVLENRNVVLARGAEIGEAPRLAVSDPLFEDGRTFHISQTELESSWTGYALLTLARAGGSAEKTSFGFSWFMRKLSPSRSLIRDIVVAALGMNLLILAVPLFFQIILDKVLPHQAMVTLISLTIGMGILLVFDTAFNYLRQVLLAHANRKFEQSISDELVEHLISLPVTYFKSNASGVLLHRMNDASHVKDFLASQVFNTILDMTAVIIFLPILAIYSLKLTAVVLFLTAIAFVVLFVASRRFNHQLRDMHAVEGRRKAYLVEIIQGIETIKTRGVENFVMRRWRRLSTDYVNCSFDLGKTSAMARAIIGGCQRGVPVVIGALGVLLVLDHQMTVGALIAFNMMGTRVSGPLIQCAALLQDYEKAVLSLRLVGELMRVEPESSTGELAAPLRGDIEFEGVSFSYPHVAKPALRSVSLKFEAGSTIGIVGRSGSGKTTMARLLQKLYLPETGIIRIDGQDIREIETRHLRTSIGLVMQDNFFFRGTVRENLALGHPELSMQEVVRAAEMAGAHEFIQRLPQGYGTLLSENASNLSGGQRQRLAIARALIGRPRLMVFDEATSALDPESEALVRSSLRRIARDRTTIIITHRLSFVRDADQIVVLDGGEVAAVGRHDQLVRDCPLYREFWNQQAKVMA